MTSAQQSEHPGFRNSRESRESAAPPLVLDLGRISYADAYVEQRRLHQEVVESRGEANAPIGYVLLLEHEPAIITVSKRPGATQHLLASPRLLASQGIEIAQTDRGGDITYHGPGQLVAYAILDLNRLRFSLRSYMRWLEEIVIETLSRFEIQGERDACATGVWVRSGPKAEQATLSRDAAGDSEICPAGGSEPATAKICAMGVRISRWVSMHGLALNVDPNLDHFRLIVPCGLAGRAVTSMRELLNDACPSMREVKQALRQAILAGAQGQLQSA